MSTPVRAWLLAIVACGFSTTAAAQGWAVDVSAGRTVYNPVFVDVGASNVTGTLRYDTSRESWVYGAAAAPFGTQAPFWGGVGAGGRVAPRGWENRRAAFGADVEAHGFRFRDAVLKQTGNGGTVDAIPFVSLSAGGATRIELRGGWRGQSLSYGGATQSRGVLEAGARATSVGAVRLQGEARFVRATEGTFPFVGGSVAYGGSPVSVWVQGGRWVSTELDDVTWGTGIGIALGPQASVWASVQQQGSDPLYWNAPRRTWSAGITRRFGHRPQTAISAPRAEPGGVLIRVPVGETSTTGLSIAGSFNAWKPVAMQRNGGDWVIRLPLDAGIYQYAFRSATGEWFVPASVPGRRDDGMGGSVAVLVVH